MKKLLLLSFVGVLCVTVFLFAGTTGKIAGTITDVETGETLPGVNVLIEGTSYGAVTNLEGYYVILNVPPGTYTLKAKMVGYAEQRIQGVRVEIDLTTTINVKLKPEVLEGETITVVATRPVVQQDISASQANVEAAQVAVLPIQRVSEVVGVQAGILGLEVRGGAAGDLAFMLDGAMLRDERTNAPLTNISLASVKEVKVQTGGFNAEYGNVRSGIANVVTKEGERDAYSSSLRFEYSPPAPKHFGPSAYAPDSYWNYPYLNDEVCWIGTEAAWSSPEKRYLQRQYPRFIGWNAISQQTLQDNDPNNDLTPEAAKRVYEWQHRRQGDIKEPDYILDVGFGGPVPFISRKLGNLRFFGAYNREQNMYLVPYATDRTIIYSTQLKLTSNITKNIKLTVSGLYSELSATTNSANGLATYFYSVESVAAPLHERSYIDALMYAPEYWCPTWQFKHSVSARLTHTLSPKTFYEASIERFGAFYKTYPNPLRDTTPIIKFGENYWLDMAPYGFMPYPSTGINGLRMGVGMSNARDYSRLFTYTGKFDITSQVDKTNQIKSGVEFVYNDHHVRYGSIDITLPVGRPWSIWDKQPIRAGAYVQDKIEFKGMIANLGVRFDYSYANSDWYDVATYDRDFYSAKYDSTKEDLYPKKPAKALYYFSPRLGISHPITVSSKIYFNYGHFRQIPAAENLYIVQRYTDKSMSRIGDPNLELSRTVAYELGYEQNFFNQFLIRLATYYRDIMFQPATVTYTSADNKVNYAKLEANNYEDVRGFEISLERRMGPWVTGIINYNYMVQTSGYFGRRQYFENPADQMEYDRNNIYQEKPLPQPYVKANIAFQSPNAFGPKVLGMQPLSNWILGIQFFWRAGEYFTWTGGGTVPGVTYNAQYPDYHNVDLRISKAVSIRNYRFEFYLNINNALNTKILSNYCFADGQDRRDYLNSLHWGPKVGQYVGPYDKYGIGYGDDKFGDLRPDNVPYDPFEQILANPNNDEAIAQQNAEIIARNKARIKSKSYIDNPNLKYLYYLNPRDIFFGIKIEF